MVAKSSTPRSSTRTRTKRKAVLKPKAVKAVRKKAEPAAIRLTPAKPHKHAEAAAWSENAWSEREKAYTKLFGSLQPKGKVLTGEGEFVTPRMGVGLGLCVMQFGPRADCMSWIYATHGLNRHPKSKGIELFVHWKRKDPKASAAILCEASRQILESGDAPQLGQLISIGESNKTQLAHWIICSSTHGDSVSRDGLKLLLLLGITDAEYQCALKVRSDLADGRKVLSEALRAGGIFPVTDPARGCMTRRRDFNRIWEKSFHAARKQPKGN